MINILMLLIFVVFGLIFLNKSAMKKFKLFFSAMLGKSADNALKIDPVAVYRERVGKAAEDLKVAVSLLESHAALVKQLKRKLEDKQKEYTLIENRVKGCMESDPVKAEGYALTLVKLEDDIQHTKVKLASSESTYSQQVAKIKNLKETIYAYKEKADQLNADLQTSKSEAEISELTQKFNSHSLGLDDLSEAEKVIQDEIDKNESKSAVAQDLCVPDVKDEILESDRTAKAKELLDRLKTKA